MQTPFADKRIRTCAENEVRGGLERLAGEIEGALPRRTHFGLRNLDRAWKLVPHLCAEKAANNENSRHKNPERGAFESAQDPSSVRVRGFCNHSARDEEECARSIENVGEVDEDERGERHNAEERRNETQSPGKEIRMP